MVIADIDAERGQEVARGVNADGGEALFVQVDVASSNDVENMISETKTRFGRLDCAVNNAGIEHAPARIADCTEEQWDRTIAVNLKSVFLCLKFELGLMREQGGGVIVNTASIAGLGGAPTLGPYAASKHGVVGLTRTAAVEYGKAGIRVNAVSPGYTRTDMVERLLAEQPEMEAMLNKASPMRRMGQPQEVARTIVWLCSESSSFINGQAVAIDGGITAW